jgi:arylsulfatase A
MKRKQLLSTSLYLITTTLLITSCKEKKSTDGNKFDSSPNFIIINIDDLGYGDIEPFGSVLNRTPNLDRLANEGALLTNFYAAPVCSPSRASLMTGCYPKRVLPLAQNVHYPGDSVGLSPNEITIAEILKNKGYSTGIVGKWHLGDQPEFLPARQGFDYYFGLPYSNDMGHVEDGARNNLGASPGSDPGSSHVWAGGYPPLPYIRNEKFVQRVLAEDQQECVERYTNEALNFIQNNYKKPFFLYLAHTAVHWPLYPGKAFVGKSKNGLYGDWVEEVDWSVGKIFDKIKKLNIDNNTLIIFVSDNGGAKIASNGPLRGHKGTTWEGGVRVPFIARWPGKIQAGIKIDAITGMMDILPTLAEISGGKIPADRKIDGKSIWPLLSGKPDAREPHEAFYFYRTLQLQAVRQGKWKLHLQNGELYNLEEDVGESNDVSANNKELVQQLYLLADEMDNDLGKGGPSRFEGVGPGCRPLGQVPDAKPIIDKNGNVRDEFLNP